MDLANKSDASSAFSLRPTAQQMQWTDTTLLCVIAVFVSIASLCCIYYCRCCECRNRRQENQMMSAMAVRGDMEEPLLGELTRNKLPVIVHHSLAREYEPSAPPMCWELEQRGSLL
ncbi:unnamed protein product [Hyaloperonospora brassicae]|uniref:RxLR effector candidate protein n=1 Tax=Hyaloperonospora brassicae TaxID=162125 RepID=A0AAV0T0X3_HYABA|nr:unnamed protein product [Hyaloperonospora brassicae]